MLAANVYFKMKFSVFVHIIVNLLLVIPVQLQLNLQPGDFCIITKTGFSGKCVRIRQCPSAVAELEANQEPQTCSYEGRNRIVCCQDNGDTGVTKNSISEEKCRAYGNEVADLNVYSVTREKDAVIQEFPHMAALGFGNKNDIKWQCGGSLISEQFVLTAAHCLYSKEMGLAEWVRLGDLDLDSGPDVKRDYQITRSIFHPDYKPPSVYNDIGLVQLEAPVTFTPFIKPACVFAKTDLSEYIDIIATGWGLAQFGGDSSNILQKLYLDLFSEEECTNTYKSITNTKRLPYGIQHDQQFCAGGRGFEKNTCQGDSGGPLQTFRFNYGLYAIVGITSFGKGCGIANVPGVYTKVSNYVPWIESEVWP